MLLFILVYSVHLIGSDLISKNVRVLNRGDVGSDPRKRNL